MRSLSEGLVDIAGAGAGLRLAERQAGSALNASVLAALIDAAVSHREPAQAERAPRPHVRATIDALEQTSDGR